MSPYLLYNGFWHPSDQPAISASNRAFRYGDALFESIRIHDGKLCFLTEHLSRLRNGMKLLKMVYPPALEEENLRPALEGFVRKNEIAGGARMRITVFREGEGQYTPTSNAVSFLVELSRLPNSQYTLNKAGLTVGVYDEQKKTINALSGIKSTNCLTYILAGIYKTEKGWDECLIVNDLGNLAESVSSNLFISFNGVLYTPALTQGCLPGIMREQVIKLAAENKIEVQECPMSPETLFRADEVFLTNAIQGVQWVGAFKGKRYFNKISAFFTEKLNGKVLSSRMDLQEK